MGQHPSKGINAVQVMAGTLGAIDAGALDANDLLLSGQAALVRDGIPPRLKTVLTGDIENIQMWVSNANSVAPNLTVRFFGNDDKSTAAGTNIRILGEEEFDQEFVRVSGQTRTYIGEIGGLEIPYHDFDDTGEWHFEVHNPSATNVTQCSLSFHFRPSFPV